MSFIFVLSSNGSFNFYRFSIIFLEQLINSDSDSKSNKKLWFKSISKKNFYDSGIILILVVKIYRKFS